MEVSNKKRFANPDVIRGIAMLYIVEMHVVGMHDKWIDTWAIPVFFVIMGLFFKPGENLCGMLIKKARSLLVPLVLLSIPAYLKTLISSPHAFLIGLLNPYNCIHGVGWFLLCMFWAYLIFYCIVLICGSRQWLRIVLSISLSCFFWYLATFHAFGHRLFAPWFITTSFVSTALIDAGYELKHVILKPHKQPVSSFFALVLALFVFWGVGGTSSLGYPGIIDYKSIAYNCADWQGQSYIICTAFSLISSFSVLLLADRIPSFLAKPLRYIGEHSLLLLMVHPYIQMILTKFHMAGWLLYITVVVLSVLIIIPVSHYFPVLEGKIKR